MQIQSINNAQHSKKQNFGAHFNFTKTGKKFVSDLTTRIRREAYLTVYASDEYHKSAVDVIKQIDKSLGKDMVITLNKLEDNKYHGTLSKGPYKSDFEFENHISEDGCKGSSRSQLWAMGAALKSSAKDIRDSGKNLVDSLAKRIDWK